MSIPIPKYVARDCELSTTGQDYQGETVDGWEVTRKLLDQLPQALAAKNVTVWSHGDQYSSRYSMDCLRRWTSAGQCFYSDMSHAEGCTAEVLSPRAFAAQSLSLLRAFEQARVLAEAADESGARFDLSSANVDALEPSISWGTHMNVSVTNELWEDLFESHRHPGRLGFVASAFAAGTPLFGTGYLLPLKDGSVIYSLSSRAHHLSEVHTLSTTNAFRRGILNTRREPHGEMDRLHLINFDYALVSAPLLATYVQCVLAAAESGFSGLLLDDPVRALRVWSWNLDLRTGQLPATAALIDGQQLTLPAYVRALTQRLLEMCESGELPASVVPEATELLPIIIELTEYIEEGSLDRCARHLDWAAKLMVLQGVNQPLEHAQARLMDHDFAHTNPRRGAFWQLWEEELIDPLVSLADADACVSIPPGNSRAWGRGELIRRFHSQITDVDWSRIELRDDVDRWSPRLAVKMSHLDDFTRDRFERVLELATSVKQLAELLDEPHQTYVTHTDPLADIPQQLATSYHRGDDKSSSP